jgi:hypothetical protein
MLAQPANGNAAAAITIVSSLRTARFYVSAGSDATTATV